MSLPTEASFLKDVATHVMTLKKDEGLYRHVTFQRPLTNCYRFDLVTWPGYLAYSGDMGCYVFSRIPDMFEFFRPDEGKEELRINLGYWGEKVEARDRDGVREYSAERFIEHVNRHLDEREASERDRRAAKYEVIDQAHDGQHAAYSAAMSFKGPDGTKFRDLYECNSDEYTYRFIWCCYALAWGIRQYDAAAASRATSIAVTEPK